MQTYLFPIKVAFITFPLLAFFFTFPFIIYQYRKYGYINKLRVFVLYSFLLYLMVAYYLVILPLPKTFDVRSLQREGTQYYQLIPFNFIFDFLKETTVVFTNPSTFINILKERAFLQAAFNGILLTPLGIYLRYYFRKDLKKTIFITFLVSLFFEITQLTGLYGIYNAPYRIFDVDDLLLNTLGGCIGYFIAPVFTFFLPQSNELDQNMNLQEMRVSYVRRFLAFFIDWSILGFIPHIEDNILMEGIVIFIYFILIVYFTNGKTIGKSLLKIKIKGQEEKLSFKEVFTRYGILYYGVFGVNKLLFKTIDINKSEFVHYILIVMLIVVVINTILFLHLLLCIIKKDRMLFYEKISKTKNIIHAKIPIK
ncbi:VanZ family protein [Inediibacterium massiliense]|uniref:VanZ family protein n=1 Tax=Inediibacterium massiliense TaxID=1658111 RepID=UPI0006B520B3|nr:VanZ family protein [Inediibacterium massiliense]